MTKATFNVQRSTFNVEPATRASRITHHGLVSLFFLAWAVGFSYPLVLHLGDGVVQTRGGDAWLHLWNLWWVDKALVDLHRLPYDTTYLYHPTGLNLYYHSLNLFNGLVSIPLQHLFGLQAAFNLLVLANLALDGLAAYWLCLDRTRSVAASLVGGAVFASTPLLGTSLDLGQLDEVTVWWVPLYIMALWRALDSPGAVWQPGGGRRATLVAGLCLVGASLATWYFTAGLAIFTALFVPAYLVSQVASRTKVEGRTTNDEIIREQTSDVRRLTSETENLKHSTQNSRLRATVWAVAKPAATTVIFIVVLSPLLWAMVRERLGGATYMLPALPTTLFNSADLVGLLLPARVDTDVNRHGSSVALGYVPLVLAAVGLIWRWRKLWPVGLALLGLVLMSMGPELQVGGNRTGIPLPYALLNNVPFVGASRQPLRFLATAGACLSLLSAFGAGWLLSLKDEGRKTNRAHLSFVIPLAMFLVALETFILPRVVVGTGPDSASRFLKEDATPGAVLEVPTDLWSAPSLWHQTLHERPIVGGYTSRHFPYPFAEGAPGVAQLVGQDPEPLIGDDILTPPVSATALSSLDYYDVRFVVVHKGDLATGRYGRLESVLQALYTDADKAYEDEAVIIYETPADPAAIGRSPSRLPRAGLGLGWHSVEGGPLHRWMGRNDTDGNASVWIGVPPSAEGRYRLRLNAYSYNSPRRLALVLDGRILLEEEIGTAFEEIDSDLGDLREGNHQLLLRVAEPPESPPGDARKLSIGVTSIVVERVE